GHLAESGTITQKIDTRDYNTYRARNLQIFHGGQIRQVNVAWSNNAVRSSMSRRLDPKLA
ncbi:MAG TPA: hypothetical protein PLD41_15505, partial [Casimicrobium huifangae]|nr:hypothetical protein [Casimicrobium huifangae]